MNLLFQRRHTYEVNRPIDQVQTRLKWIVTRRWDDLSMDLVGRMQQDGQFSLSSKFGLTNISWLDDSPAYIRGSLDSAETGTSIRITTKPNTILVFFFYFSLLLFAMELLNMEQLIPLEKNIKTGIAIAINCLILVAMHLLSNRIKKRFERLMQLPVKQD
ncbi:MAG TPA: hypothetical protein VFR58_00615 [Flavisolibacter sp.]|nr:hypothetical protein [Flavisolibacter sp.]